MPGVENKTRPITKNITSIIEDAIKLKSHKGKGIIAFVLFPIKVGSDDWKEYLNKISESIGKQLMEEEHCSRVVVALDEDNNKCEVVICCFSTED